MRSLQPLIVPFCTAVGKYTLLRYPPGSQPCRIDFYCQSATLARPSPSEWGLPARLIPYWKHIDPPSPDNKRVQNVKTGAYGGRHMHPYDASAAVFAAL